MLTLCMYTQGKKDGLLKFSCFIFDSYLGNGNFPDLYKSCIAWAWEILVTWWQCFELAKANMHYERLDVIILFCLCGAFSITGKKRNEMQTRICNCKVVLRENTSGVFHKKKNPIRGPCYYVYLLDLGNNYLWGVFPKKLVPRLRGSAGALILEYDSPNEHIILG